MLINALLRAEGNDKAELERWINAESFERAEKVASVTALYNKLGIDKMAKERMESYYQQALSALAKVDVAEEKKTPLMVYAAKMMKRDK